MSDDDDTGAVVGHYEDEIREEDRIATGMGRLELLRTQEILRRHLPKPPAEILAHRNPGNHPSWFTTAFFHRPDELRREVDDAELELVELVGVEGIAHWMRHLDERWENDEERETILFAARAIEAEPSLLGLSSHLIAVATTRGRSCTNR